MLLHLLLDVHYWRAKRTLSGEVDGKLCIALHVRSWYIYICRTFITCTFITRRVHGRLYGLDLKNGHLRKPALDTIDSSIMKKAPADLKDEGKKPGYTCSFCG